MAQVGAEPFERRGCGRHDATIPAGQHYQPGQDGQLVVFNGLREQDVKQFGVGATARRAQAEVLLALYGVALSAPFGLDVFVDHVWHNTDLLGHEPHHGSGRALGGPQRAAGVAQVAEHQRITEPVVVATAPLGRGQVLRRQGEMAHQFALLGRRVEQLRKLGLTQLLPSRHSGLLSLGAGRPADPGKGVDQRAALDAERAADRGFGGAAIEGGRHRPEFLGIDRHGAASPATATGCCSKPGLHALLDQRPFELRERAEDVEHQLPLRGQFWPKRQS